MATYTTHYNLKKPQATDTTEIIADLNSNYDLIDTILHDKASATHATTHVTGGTDVIPNAVSGGNSGLMSGADKQNLDAAVAIKHDHANKALLDTYTQTEANLADAVAKKHTQNTDTGTSQNAFSVGDGTAGSDKYLYLKKAASGNPGLRYNVTTSKLQFSNDGINWYDVGSGGGGLSLIQNGSFEIIDSFNIPWCWSKIGTATLAQDTGIKDGYSGSKAIKITSAGTSNEGISYTFRHLKPSTTYSIQIWIKATTGDTAKVWTTGGSTNLSITSTNTTGEYKTGSFTTDATPTNVILNVGSDTSGDIVWFDALTVVEGSTPPDRYLPAPPPVVLEFQDFYPVAANFPGLETLVGTNILKKYVYALDDTTEEPLGFNFSMPPRFDPSGSIMLECVGWAKTAASGKNIEYTYYYSPKKYGEDWDSSYSSKVSGDLALYSTQDYRDNLRFQLSINTAGLEAHDVVESKIARTAPSANNLSGDYYFEKLRIWIPRV